MNNLNPGLARFEIYKQTGIFWDSIDSYASLDDAMAEACDLSETFPWQKYEVVDGDYGHLIARWQQGDITATGSTDLLKKWEYGEAC